MKGIFQRRGAAIVPVSDEGREALLAIRDGEEFEADIKTSRNLRQLRLFFAMCKLLADNSEVYDTKEKAKRGLLIATGNVITWMDHLGILHIDPESISFAAMEQGKFNQFFQLAVAKICEWLGNAPKEVTDRLYQMVDPIKGATIPNKPEPPLDAIEQVMGRMPEPEVEYDRETGEILSPPPLPEPEVPRKIVEPVVPPTGQPIKWKALAQGLMACKDMDEARDRAKRFWKWQDGGWPPANPADETKGKMINSVARRYITGEITLDVAHTEMEKALAL